MLNNGYLAEYPVIFFKTEGLGIITEKPYVMACGHHQRKAEIVMVLCEVHHIALLCLSGFQSGSRLRAKSASLTKIEVFVKIATWRLHPALLRF